MELLYYDDMKCTLQYYIPNFMCHDISCIEIIIATLVDTVCTYCLPCAHTYNCKMRRPIADVKSKAEAES